jgi:6-phosphogluconolactonase (cycloisomerase 2 family)
MVSAAMPRLRVLRVKTTLFAACPSAAFAALCLLAFVLTPALYGQTVTLTPATLAFTAEAVGTTTAAKTVTVKNTSKKTALSISSIVASGDFAFTTTCGSTLAADSSCTLSVTSTPETIGTIDGAITLTDNATPGTQVVNLSGKGLAPVTLAPTSLTFASTDIGSTSAAKTITLTNSDAALTMGTISTSGDFAVSATTCTGTIAASKTCTVSVTFTPSNSGTINGTLTIADSAAGSPQTLALSGTGSGTVTNTVTFSPTTLTFASQPTGTTSTGQAITLTNTATTSLSISTVSASGDYSETDTCAGKSIAASKTCAITVKFAPTTTGAIKGTITVTDAAATSPQEVSLTGTGETALGLSPATLTFKTTVGTPSSAQTVTLTNNTASAVTISSVAVSGEYTQTNTCGTSLAASANCTFSVTFAPLTTGTIDGAVTITTSVSTTPVVISAVGTATAPPSTVARYAYALEYSEYTQGMVVAYAVNPTTGALRALETVQLPGTNYGITVHPSNQFLYIPYGQEILGYSIGTNGMLQPIAGQPFNLPGGSTLTFIPSGAFGFSNTGAVFSVNTSTGVLTQVGSGTTGDVPYDATLTPNGDFLYIPNYQDGTISAFSVDQTTGALTEVTGSPFADGDVYPAASAVSPNGKFLFVANFSTDNAGSISVFSINATTGALTAVTGSPFTGSGPANNIAINPAGTSLFVAANGVNAYSINATTGALTAVSGSPFTTPVAPYGVTVDPTGKFLYASIFGNLTTTQTAPDVITFSIGSTGALTQLSAQGVDGNQGEALALTTGSKAVTYTPKFAYVTNEIDSTISEFTINDSTGALTAVTGSPISDTNGPFAVAATPSGAFVYTADYNSSTSAFAVSEYSVNATTGALTLVSGSPITGFGAIAGITVDPTSSYLLVADATNEVIDTYTINPATGALTALSSAATQNHNSQAVTFDATGIITEFISSNFLDYFRFNNGAMVALTSTSFAEPAGAVASDRSSQYAFVTQNQGETITTYSVPALNSLSVTSTGNGPVAVLAEPSGKYVYVGNQIDGTVSAYSLNSATGALTEIGTAITAAEGTNSLAVSLDGKYLYAADGGDAEISIFSIGSTGALTLVETAATGNGPSSIATTGTNQ